MLWAALLLKSLAVILIQERKSHWEQALFFKVTLNKIDEQLTHNAINAVYIQNIHWTNLTTVKENKHSHCSKPVKRVLHCPKRTSLSNFACFCKLSYSCGAFKIQFSSLSIHMLIFTDQWVLGPCACFAFSRTMRTTMELTLPNNGSHFKLETLNLYCENEQLPHRLACTVTFVDILLWNLKKTDLEV